MNPFASNFVEVEDVSFFRKDDLHLPDLNIEKQKQSANIFSPLIFSQKKTEVLGVGTYAP